MRAVGEKLFSEKLFSEPGSLRETILEKPFSKRSFYEVQPRIFLVEVVLREVALLEVVLREAVLRKP